MGKMDGRVVVISGAARGQGRAHAVTLAREGASIVAFDVCAPLATVLTPGATEEDLAETKRLVEAEGQSCLTAPVDARDLPGLQALAKQTLEEFGRIDCLIVNHGMWHVAPNTWELEEDAWQESIDVMLTGSWKTAKAFIPGMIEGERGGSIVFITSANATVANPGCIDYCASKAGIKQMARVLAWELGKHRIRVNTVAPGAIDTPILHGGTIERAQELHPEYQSIYRNFLPVGLQPPESISNAIRWLVSDDAEYVTGIDVPVDSGWTAF